MKKTMRKTHEKTMRKTHEKNSWGKIAGKTHEDNCPTSAFITNFELLSVKNEN